MCAALRLTLAPVRRRAGTRLRFRAWPSSSFYCEETVRTPTVVERSSALERNMPELDIRVFDPSAADNSSTLADRRCSGPPGPGRRIEVGRRRGHGSARVGRGATYARYGRRPSRDRVHRWTRLARTAAQSCLRRHRDRNLVGGSRRHARAPRPIRPGPVADEWCGSRSGAGRASVGLRLHPARGAGYREWRSGGGTRSARSVRAPNRRTHSRTRSSARARACRRGAASRARVAPPASCTHTRRPAGAGRDRGGVRASACHRRPTVLRLPTHRHPGTRTQPCCVTRGTG